MDYAPVPSYQSQEEEESDICSTSSEASSDIGNEPIDLSYLNSLPRDRAAELAFNTAESGDVGVDSQANQSGKFDAPSSSLNDAEHIQVATAEAQMADDTHTIATFTSHPMNYTTT